MNTRKAIFYFLMTSHTAFLICLLYGVWTREISLFPGAIYIVTTLVLIRHYIRVYRTSSPVDVVPHVDVPMRFSSARGVTRELITEILSNANVVALVRDDLAKTRYLSHKEEWRFGLITPDQDLYNPNPNPAPLYTRVSKVKTDYNYRLQSVGQIPLKRTAVLNSTTYFKYQLSELVVMGGTIEPMIPVYPGWSYPLFPKINEGELIEMRNIEVKEHAGSSGGRGKFLSDFLRESGFPLKTSYTDGDPLTTDRGGTIVIDRGKVIVIYPRYFVQRRLIDDEGNLVDLGIDENFNSAPIFEVKMQPSISRLLIQGVSANHYVPVVRYRSLPFASDFMLPLLDTPMSANGWADLYIDTRGEAKLFVAKEKTEAEWYEMMGRLQRLFYAALAKKDHHLLALTKDKTHLNEYLAQKQLVLQDYFIIQDFSFPLCGRYGDSKTATCHSQTLNLATR